MSDTVTVDIEEIEAVAAKVDAGDPLTDHDRTVFRGLLVLAGERVADLAGGEVEGFDLGPSGISESLSFNFSTIELAPSHDGGSLFRNCCTGKHFPSVSLYMRKAGGS